MTGVLYDLQRDTWATEVAQALPRKKCMKLGAGIVTFGMPNALPRVAEPDDLSIAPKQTVA